MNNKVLVVGQTPPPFGGQAMMIDKLVKAKFENIRILHIRMAFSGNFKSVGNFSISKLFHLPSLVFKIIYTRFRYNVNVFYYSPAGPNLNPVLRDLILLTFTRPFFEKIIFHFNAAGISEFLEKASPVIRYLGKRIYGRPDAAIQNSLLNPADGEYFSTKKKFIIKNGLPDDAKEFLPIKRVATVKIKILFVGVLTETKGIMTIVNAVRLLQNKGINFSFICLGEFASLDFEKEVKSKCKEYNVEKLISFPGVKIGAAKWKMFLEADVFCFPSFFESESFGNVLVEAMMFELPTIATRWRGIPDIVDDHETGFLIPIKDPDSLAEKIIMLAHNPEQRTTMGLKGRRKFLNEFTLSSHLQSMEKMFLEVINSKT